jgi:PHD/YefM family antitoxin component YafN of YafNO toxin-antitoxin module
MPVIRNSTDLSSNYLEIADFCHKFKEPVFLTRNGEDDLAIMSIETYKEMSGRYELYRLIQEGIDDIENGRTLTKEDIIKNMNIVMRK